MFRESDTRRQVKAEIIQEMAAAHAAGESDVVEAARRAFPGIPDMVLWGCWSEFEDQQTEAWWQRVERTIDGEVIRNAVATVGASGGAA